MPLRNDIWQYLIALIFGALLALAMVGCKCPCTVIPSGASQQRDSVRIEYKHDSIYTDRWHKEYIKGDTVFIHDSIWRDRWRTRIDTFMVNKSDTIYSTIEVEKKSSAFLRNSGIALWVLIGALIIGVIIGIIIKIAK